MSKRQQRVHFLEELCNCLAYSCGWDCKATPCGWVSKLLERMTETEYSKHSQTIPPLTLSHTISCVGLWHFTLETLSTRATLHGEPATHRLFKKRDSLPFPLTAASQQYVCMPCSSVSCLLVPPCPLLSLSLAGHMRIRGLSFPEISSKRKRNCFTIHNIHVLH